MCRPTGINSRPCPRVRAGSDNGDCRSFRPKATEGLAGSAAFQNDDGNDEQGEADPAKADHDPGPGRDHVGGLIVAASKRKAAMNRQVRPSAPDEGDALGEGIGMPPHQRQQEDLAQGCCSRRCRGR